MTVLWVVITTGLLFLVGIVSYVVGYYDGREAIAKQWLERINRKRGSK